eukprot:scpid66908/ scgid32750/ 
MMSDHCCVLKWRAYELRYGDCTADNHCPRMFDAREPEDISKLGSSRSAIAHSTPDMPLILIRTVFDTRAVSFSYVFFVVFSMHGIPWHYRQLKQLSKKGFVCSCLSL